MFTTTTPYCQPLHDHLVMQSISTHADIERLVAFNHTIHGDGVDRMTRNLILHHPHTRPEHWFFIKDETTDQIVSSLCLIPWTWRYADITLKAGEMGIVGTLKPYRNQGLIRALVTRFKELLHQGHYDLSHIQGIPYYYRQFGYEYAIPLIGGWRVDLHTIPTVAPTETSSHTFRLATVDDIPILVQIYDQSTLALDLSALRDEATWHYLLTAALETETSAETWLILDPAHQPIGYFRIEQTGFGPGLNLNEASCLNHTATVALFQKLKTLATERKKPFIRLALPKKHVLIATAHAWGAHDQGTYAWQIHFPDVIQLLHKISPVLERRIAASPFVGLSQTLCLNLYRAAFELVFQAGAITAVNAVGFKDKGDISLPPPLLAPLVLGYRSQDELKQTYHDVLCRGQSQPLIDVLFPKMESYIFTTY